MSTLKKLNKEALALIKEHAEKVQSQENGHYSKWDIILGINSSSLLDNILKVIEDEGKRVDFSIGLAKEVEKELQLRAFGYHSDAYWDTITNTVNEIYSRYMQSAEDAGAMTVKEYIHKKGWQSSVWMNGTERYMSVSISFDNNGYSSIVDFNIPSFDTDRLQTLFSAFCKENNCRKDSVTGIYIQKVSYSIEELTLCEKVNSLMSVYDRIGFAENGIALDILVYDPDPRVRRAVAKHGRDKDYDILVSDLDPWVRCTVAEKGRNKDLDILIVDPVPAIRRIVAGKRRDKDLAILKNDRIASVRNVAEDGILLNAQLDKMIASSHVLDRELAATRGCERHLNVLINDAVESVRKLAKERLNERKRMK